MIIHGHQIHPFSGVKRTLVFHPTPSFPRLWFGPIGGNSKCPTCSFQCYRAVAVCDIQHTTCRLGLARALHGKPPKFNRLWWHVVGARWRPHVELRLGINCHHSAWDIYFHQIIMHQLGSFRHSMSHNSKRFFTLNKYTSVWISLVLTEAVMPEVKVEAWCIVKNGTSHHLPDPTSCRSNIDYC